MTRATSAAIAIMIAAVSSTRVDAQERLRAQCRDAFAAQPDAREFCELATYAVEAVEARFGIVQIGGNPVDRKSVV